MEANSVIAFGICMFIAYCAVFFGRYAWLEIHAKAYCKCGHEWNEHWVIPKGYGYIAEYSSEKCKICGCKKFDKDENHPKTTPPFKFWP